MLEFAERTGAPVGARRVDRSPVFLVGSERSGTTLLRLMLDHHPALAFHGEAEFLTLRVPETGWPDLRAYHEWVRTYRGFVMSGFTIDPSLEYSALMRSFLEQKRARDGKALVGATVHRGFERLPRIWPLARYVHLVRDGRDVARSVVEMGWAGNAWAGVGTWLEAEHAWETLRAQTDARRVLEVRYEDLVRDAAEALQRICAFIGIGYDEAMFDYAQTTTYALPRPELASRWRGRMPDRDVRLVEARAGETLRARGYALSGLPAIEIDAAMRRRLRRADRLGRARFRWRRYGAALCIADTATRRLRLGGLQRRVRVRMNAIEMRHLR